MIRDLALTRDLDAESEQTAFTIDSELPPAGSAVCPGEVKQVTPVSEFDSVVRLDPLNVFFIFFFYTICEFQTRPKAIKGFQTVILLTIIHIFLLL